MRARLLQMKSKREQALEAWRKSTAASKPISETQDQRGVKKHEEDCSGQDGTNPERNVPSKHAVSESEEDQLEDDSQNGRRSNQK